MTADTLIEETTRRGVRLWRRGGKLVVAPVNLCPPALIEQLREHKAEILCLLEAQVAGLARDEKPWMHVARQVLEGEFDGADRSTVESLTIGLRGIRHPSCQQAVAKLEDCP